MYGLFYASNFVKNDIMTYELFKMGSMTLTSHVQDVGLQEHTQTKTVRCEYVVWN